MAVQGLVERFGRAHVDAPPPGLLADAVARASRYPDPVNRLWPVLVQAIDALGPSLLLGRPSRASALSDDAFDRLEQKLQYHPNAFVRLGYLLARAPILESLYAEPAPPSDPGHPLDALAERIRMGSRRLKDRFDVVVIGSGAGGAPVAWSLARKGFSVAIVEAGGIMRPQTGGGSIEKFFLDQGMVGSLDGGGSTLVLAGKALGGTTVVNSGTSLRPRQECLEGWDAQAGTRFAEGELDPWLDQVWAHLGIAAVKPEHLDASAQLVMRALELIGRPGAFPLPRNAPDCQGAARCCYGCPNGAKLSTDRSYLPGAVEAGAVLLANTSARGIRESKDGVEVFVDGPEGRRKIRARHLVLGAGALSTPGLIRHNRLGDRSGAAGDHLRIHPATKVMAMMPGPLAHGGVPQALGYKPADLPRLTFEPAHMPPSVVGPVVLAAGRRHRYWMEHYDQVANYGMMVRDRATGTVRERRGLHVVGYAMHPEDANDLGRGILMIGEAFFAAGAERILMPVAGRDPEVASLAELKQLKPEDFTPQRVVTTGFHVQGSAGIGRLVDADLALLGSDRVHVADGSVLPDSPGVNPQVTIMAFGLRLADHLASARLEG